MKIGVVTDVGRVREVNQDNYCLIDHELAFYMVADGMGGHNGGEIASLLAIEEVKGHIIKYIHGENTPLEEEELQGIILEAVHRANRKILERAHEDATCDGMGTTATMALKKGDRLLLAHIGDSRAYLIHKGEIRQITQDHSLVAELVRRGSISEREAMKHPQKNIITRALGTDPQVKVDLLATDFFPGDALVLCTDGLSTFVDSYEIESMVNEIEDPQECCQALVAMANQRGGYDNITVIVVKHTATHLESR